MCSSALLPVLTSILAHTDQAPHLPLWPTPSEVSQLPKETSSSDWNFLLVFMPKE